MSHLQPVLTPICYNEGKLEGFEDNSDLLKFQPDVFRLNLPYSVGAVSLQASLFTRV